MATLAKDSPRTFELHGAEFDNQLPCIASDIIYEGAAVGENGSGYFRPLVAGDAFAGFALEICDNSTGAAGDRLVRLRSRGVVVMPITGATAVTDEGSTVYASDDDTLTLTASTNTAIGKVLRYISGTTCAIYFEAATLRSL
jgi:predicted RecA/RadA family phage recombinase